MIHIISRDLPKRRLHIRRDGTHFYKRGQAWAAVLLRPSVLRALVLLLVALMIIFAGLMAVTGHYEAGAPVIGSVLLIGLGASHWS